MNLNRDSVSDTSELLRIRQGRGSGPQCSMDWAGSPKKRLKCTEIVIRSKGKHRDEVGKFMSDKGAQLLLPVGNNGKEWLWKIP